MSLSSQVAVRRWPSSETHSRFGGIRSGGVLYAAPCSRANNGEIWSCEEYNRIIASGICDPLNFFKFNGIPALNARGLIRDSKMELRRGQTEVRGVVSWHSGPPVK